MYAAADLRAAAARLAEIDAAQPSQRSLETSGARDAAATGSEAAAGAAESLADVVGHRHAKRALIVAAAGGHSLLMVGPPGSGKSMLATRLAGLLPPLSASEALEVASIASVAGQRLDLGRWTRRPFRAPHHTASAHAIVGGGPQIRPGEISLAHHGVLFLDELPEFDRRVLESLREPLESGAITIVRTAARLELPARFQLVGAMNPCPCGYLGDPVHAWGCTPGRVERYRQRISGPLLDRIDIRIEVPRPGACTARGEQAEQGAAPPAPFDERQAVSRVQAARHWRLQRSGCLASRLSAEQL